MKLYGYKTTEVDVTTWSTGELAELTLVANPTELRRIAAFLHATAQRMEDMGGTYSHEHLSDKAQDFETSPHFVVAPPHR